MSYDAVKSFAPYVTRCCGEIVPRDLIAPEDLFQYEVHQNKMYASCKKHGKTILWEQYKYSLLDTYKGELHWTKKLM